MTKHVLLHEYYSKALGQFLDVKGYDLACITKDNRILIKKDGYVVRFNGVLFICPLCNQQLFLKNYLKKSVSDYLSLDHVPPQSVGGKLILPVCNACNSTFGATIDKALLEFVKFSLFITETPKTKVPATIKFGESRFLRVQMEFLDFKEKAIGVTLPKLSGDNYRMFQEHLSAKKPVSFTVKDLNNYEAGLGLLKIAYLLMFYYFGYEFVMNKNAASIRDILLQKSKHPLTSLGVLNMPEYKKMGISIMLQPKETECYVCSFSLTEPGSKRIKHFMVAMPGPGEEAWHKYLQLDNIAEGTDVGGFFITTPPLEKDLFDAYSGYWRTRHAKQ